ncbi:hypothetical protein BDZ88DRAFT_422932 [Geranomyces variabilis]|nr:hypothetical protein BDZ88DRAFT_422932 [Geranomyces variabilis]KAJ3134410.1 hypothetical protein HDU90_005023 [Geranomyces variabilis]
MAAASAVRSQQEKAKDRPLLRGPHNTTYATVLAGVTFSMETFYRTTRTQGLNNLPKYRGCIVAANHWNMAIDIGALMQTCPRKVHFWTKAELFHGPTCIRKFMNAMGCLPVKRNSRSGKKESNDDLFQHTINTLSKGGVIAIFPEGTSHHSPHLTELKDGASWAALQNAAATADPADYAPLVPVGITYEPLKYTWRHRVNVRYGTPVEVGPFLEEFERDQRSAVKKLTLALEAALREVTINAPDWETLNAARQLQSVVLGHTACADDLETISIILELIDAKTTAFTSVVQQVGDYHISLQGMGLKDKDLEIGNVPTITSLASHFVVHMFFAFVSLLYVIPSFLVSAPAFFTLMLLRHKEVFPESKAQKQIFSGYVIIPLCLTIVHFVLSRVIGFTTPLAKAWFFLILVLLSMVFPRAEDYRRQTFDMFGTSTRLLFARIMCGRGALHDVLRQRDHVRGQLQSHIDPIKWQRRAKAMEGKSTSSIAHAAAPAIAPTPVPNGIPDPHGDKLKKRKVTGSEEPM